MSTTDHSGIIKAGDTAALLKQASESDQIENRTVGVAPGQGVEPPYAPEHLASLLELNGIHATAVAKKARREVGFGFDIVPARGVTRDAAAEEEREAVEGFWRSPTTNWKLGPAGTPFATPTEVFENARQDYHSIGWLAIEVLYAGTDEVPQGLAHIPAQTIRQRDGDHGYVYEQNGETVFLAQAGDRQLRHEDDATRFVDKQTGDIAESSDGVGAPSNEVLFVPNPHPNAPNGYGIPDWVAELRTILLDAEARRFNRQRLENDLMLDYIITVEGGELTEETRSQMREWLSEMRESDEPELLYLEAEELAETATANGVTSGVDISIEPAAHFNDEDQSFGELRERNKRDIALAHDTPLAVLGEHDATNSNSREAIREFTDEVIKPAQQRFEARIYSALHQQVLGVSDWALEFVTRGAAAPQRDADVARTVMQAVGESLTINEARELADSVLDTDIDGIEELEGELFGVVSDPVLADELAQAFEDT